MNTPQNKPLFLSNSSSMAIFVSANSWHFLTTLIICCFLLGCDASESNGSDQQVYIVYMGHRPEGEFTPKMQHFGILQATLGSNRASESWIRSYERSFNGFVAKLTEEEKNRIASLDEVVSVLPNSKMQLHTTRSWDFVGFPLTSSRSADEGDIIVCVMDTGIWPESPSFDDTGLGPPPTKWKGTCESSSNFTCNNKIIGARFYHTAGPIRETDFPSPRDSNGHGSHTASTAAGRAVLNASLDGLARGTARGGVPNSRIAVYKVCWSDGCQVADILSAFDDAIADKCDLISASLGPTHALEFFNDVIGIGSYHSMKKGILTSNSAGNDGRYGTGTVVNVAPWSITVAANVIDRKFQTKVQLGNKNTYEGGGVINTFTLEKDFYPLLYGGNAPAKGYTASQARHYSPGSLDPKLVKGKIVLCDGWTEEPFYANATGAIMIDDWTLDGDSGWLYAMAASVVNSSVGSEISNYINTTSKPMATIHKSVEIKETRAPFVVPFSSRGPSIIDPEVLKPDITAPGTDILAAWSDVASPSEFPEDPRKVKYNIISGTSMSCPHVTGAAAYVKSFNPSWSPSAIKSALMTTATPMTLKDNKDGEFSYGAGQIDPLKAKSPGLVYDMVEADYIGYLCGKGYSDKTLRLITGDNTTSCVTKSTVYDLNYPGFVVSASTSSTTRTFHRTVTNVGTPSSTYKAIVTPTEGLKIVVSPEILSFKSIGETKKFTVTVSYTDGSEMMRSQLIWDDGKHTVRSPIVINPAI